MRRTLSSMHTQWISQALAVALVLLGGNLAAAEPPLAQEKTNAKESTASFRAYLPTIRLKALLDDERQSVADLEEWLRRYEVWLEAGFVNLMQRGRIEALLHRSQLRALRLDTDYRDSLDRFMSRVRISEERRRQMEVAATAPLAKTFQRFEELSRDWEAAIIQLHEMARPENVAKARPALVRILIESALVKNITLPKRFLKCWDDWKKIDDRRKLFDRTLEIQRDLNRLRERQNELLEKQQELPDADRKRMEALKFELHTGEFQRALIHYEGQPWKNKDNDGERLRNQRDAFLGLERIFGTLLDHAYVERFEGLVQSWPGLAPVKIEGVDLLAGKRDRAEETVPWELKSPDAQLASKKMVRHIRTLAESYRIQQRMFHLAYQQIGALKAKIASPPDAHADKDPIGSPTLPEAIREFSQVRRQLVQTWIDYQMVRLDLFGDLGLSPPER